VAGLAIDTAIVDIEMGNFSFIRGLHYARKGPKEAVGAAANSILARPTMWVCDRRLPHCDPALADPPVDLLLRLTEVVFVLAPLVRDISL